MFLQGECYCKVKASSPAASVDRLLQARTGAGPSLWREFAGRPAAGVGTGFPALDAALYDRGWPRAGLVELLGDDHGIGELRLLVPALAVLSRREESWIAWIDPPFVPYAPALQAAGIDLAKMLLVRTKHRGERLWALEQTLGGGACSAVLGWLPEAGFAELRRLLLAARHGHAWGSLFRPASVARQASAAELRLQLSAKPADRLQVAILKRRGGWPSTAVELALADSQAADSQAADPQAADPQAADTVRHAQAWQAWTVP